VPIQHITGSAAFLHFDLVVNGDVLIPRPETEILVESVLKKLTTRDLYDASEVLVDIGTGCGNIAIALADALPRAHVLAIDLSEEALSVAKENAGRYHLSDRISFLKGDLFEPLQGLHLENGVDAVICNPPYVITTDIPNLPFEVRDFEPRLALDGGQDGLAVIRKVVERVPDFLKPNGLLALEVGQHQAREVKDLMVSSGWSENNEIVQDLGGIERVVMGFKKTRIDSDEY
jgi:release factor glutamine methyltransferase